MAITATINSNALDLTNMPLSVTTSGLAQTIVSICFTDSSAAYLSGVSQLDVFRTEAISSWPDGTFSVYVDDTSVFKDGGIAVKIEPAERWIAAGFEFATAGYSGSDNLNAASPIKMTYSGAEANPILTISDSGETWTFSTDGSDAIGPLDVSRGGATVGGFDISILGIGISGGLTSYIATQASGVFDVEVVAGSGYDDTYCYTFTDDTYAAEAAIPFNQTRQLYEEMDVSIAEIGELEGIPTVESFMYGGGVSVAAVNTHAGAIDLNVSGGGIDASNIGHSLASAPTDWNDVDWTMGRGASGMLGLDYSTESAFRAEVDTLLAKNSARWMIMQMPIPPAALGTAEIIWFVDQFYQRGCALMSVKDAYDWFIANT